MNLGVLAASALAAAVVIDYGFKNTRTAFASSPAGSTAAGSPSSSSSATSPAVGPGQYTPPLSGGRKGRTDQGVDFSIGNGLAPGDPVRSIGKARVMGIIPGWYSGQPFVWTQLLDGPDAGRYVYYAEQLDPTVKAGDILPAGGVIGTIAAQGTGLELGWATANGETLAHSTTGYVEGQATAAGQDFDRLLISLGL